jgi:hypothetical protein
MFIKKTEALLALPFILTINLIPLTLKLPREPRNSIHTKPAYVDALKPGIERRIAVEVKPLWWELGKILSIFNTFFNYYLYPCILSAYFYYSFIIL